MEFSKFIDGAVFLAAFWGLLKWTVSRELKNIYAAMSLRFDELNRSIQRVEKQGDSHTRELKDLHGRVSVLEDRDQRTPGLGRRKTDHCPAPDCPWEAGAE